MVLSKENFMESLKLSFLKLRGIGEGNQNVPIN
jgi:hypothetical protein